MNPGYYVWREWRLDGGLPSERPVGLPKRVPARWWVRLALYRLRHPVKQPAPPLGSIEWGLTAFFNSPRGGIEDVSGMYVRGGLRTWFLNTREIGWDTIRGLVGRCNGTVNPWKRCYSKYDVEDLIQVAGAWGSKGIGINYEPGTETVLTVDEILTAIKDYTGTVYIITSPWMENDISWKRLAKRCVFIIEAFTNEQNHTTGLPWPVPDLVEHAHNLGALSVVAMAGVYEAVYPPPRSLAEWRRHWAGVPIVYLGDNLGADMDKWSAWNPLAP